VGTYAASLFGDMYLWYVSPFPVIAKKGDTYQRYMSPIAKPMGPPPLRGLWTVPVTALGDGRWPRRSLPGRKKYAIIAAQ
jgi:hypothetical protein